MIDYDTFCRIKHLSEHGRLTPAQIARTLALDPRTVTHWLAQPRYQPRQSTPRPSKLDPFKPTIRRLLEHHPYSAQQIGYSGPNRPLIPAEIVHRFRDKPSTCSGANRPRIPV